jgi:Sap-like sulfolipid-1-addressing protein
VSLDALALAVICAIRPTALASVYALLSSSTPPRPLAAYVIAGLASSAIAGAIVVLILHGVRLETGSSTVNAVIELAGGSAALGFAGGVATGRIRGGSRTERANGDSRVVGALRNPTLRIAAAAGVATHLPGLLYLLGLNAIARGNPPLIEGLLTVLVFDAIWLTIPICALVASIRRPDETRAAIGRVSAWMLNHERAILIVVFSGVGAYFTTRGSLDLLT